MSQITWVKYSIDNSVVSTAQPLTPIRNFPHVKVSFYGNSHIIRALGALVDSILASPAFDQTLSFNTRTGFRYFMNTVSTVVGVSARFCDETFQHVIGIFCLLVYVDHAFAQRFSIVFIHGIACSYRLPPRPPLDSGSAPRRVDLQMHGITRWMR